MLPTTVNLVDGLYPEGYTNHDYTTQKVLETIGRTIADQFDPPWNILQDWTGRYAGGGGASYKLVITRDNAALCYITINAQYCNIYGGTTNHGSIHSMFQARKKYDLADPSFDPRSIIVLIEKVIDAEIWHANKTVELLELQEELKAMSDG